MRRCVVAGVIVAVILAAGASPALAQDQTSRYDDHFRKYSKRFFGPGFDWRVFKAQGLAESNLNPRARSFAGARGLMQVMPATFDEVRAKNPELSALDRSHLAHPEWNIATAISYCRQLWLLWSDDAEEPQRMHFVFGSYNAGRSTLLRAQKLAQEQLLNGKVWESIERVAPAVARWRYQETIDYVARVFANLGRMDHAGRIVK